MKTEEMLARQVAVTRRLREEYGRRSVAHFLNNIVIPSSPDPRLFGDAADEWQRELLAPKLPAFEHLCGRLPDYGGPMRFMSILPRGHNKSSLEAWLATGAILTSTRLIHGYILAADRDQGRLILQAMKDLLQLNQWLNHHVTITRDVITGPAGDVTVLPCDAASNMGLRGNLYILDEFTHWKKQDVWNAVVSGFRKVTPTLVAALSNAGLQGSWQHDAFLEAESSRSWVVFHKRGTLASWLDRDGIEEDKRLLPASEADRLYENRWIDPAAENDYLRRPEVQRCADLGRAMGLTVRIRRQALPRVDNYVAAIDYGPRRDRTVLVVLHAADDGTVVIDRLDVWQGTPEAPVQIARVEEWVRDVRRQFGPAAWVLDGYQMEGTIQWMLREGLPVEAFNPRGGSGNHALAQHLRALVVDQRLVWYPGAGDLKVRDKRSGREHVETLVDELSALRVKRLPALGLHAYRFDHENQKHDDRAVAIGMAALKAVEFAPPAKPHGRPEALHLTLVTEEDRRVR